jgi:hypothetical protein
MSAQMIDKSPNKDFFQLLLSYQTKEAADFAKQLLQEDASRKGHLMLKHWLIQSQFIQREDVTHLRIDYEADYAIEIAELGRLVDVLISELKHKLMAERIVPELYHYLMHAADYIHKNSGDYPKTTISGKIWLDGAIVRDWALYLATYYEDLGKFQQETEMRFSRSKITNSIMNHYMHLVGPDMIGVAKCLEKINLPEKAYQFYHAVVLDFEQLIPKLSEEQLISIEDKLSLWALREAYLGLLRLKKIDSKAAYTKVTLLAALLEAEEPKDQSL